MTARRLKKWSLIVGTAAALFTIGSLYQPTVVVGESMAPTLSDGKVIYIDRFYYKNHRPQRGEVVVFVHNGDTYVKRVYRAPGETVYCLMSGGAWVGFVRPEWVNEVRKRYTLPGKSMRLVTMRVPEDQVYVVGDNLNKSEDSREIGSIPISECIGRARVAVDQSVVRPYEFAPRPVTRHVRSARADAGI
jgi:signal peptidase I